MRGTFVLLIILTISLPVLAEQPYCQEYKKILLGCDEGTCGDVIIPDALIAVDSLKTKILVGGFEQPLNNNSNKSISIQIDQKEIEKCRSVSEKQTDRCKLLLSQLKEKPSVKYSDALSGSCEKLDDTTNEQISNLANINRVVKMCSQNTFTALMEVGNVGKFCDDLEPRDVYKQICSANCASETISKKDSENAKKKLVDEAKSVILKMLRNRIFDTLDELSMIPHEGNFYEDLPKECVEASSFLDPDTKKSLNNSIKKVLENHQNILAADKEQNECFPNGIVKNYFQYSEGKFEYTDVDSGYNQSRQLDFSNKAKGYQRFSKFFDECNDGSCSGSTIARRTEQLNSVYDVIKKKAAENCNTLQNILNDLSKPENFQMALNPQILSIRNNFNNISFSGKHYPSSFIQKCSLYFSGAKEPDNFFDKECMAVKNFMCDSSGKVSGKVQELTSKDKMKDFERFSDYTYGAKTFNQTHLAISDKMCKFIKDEWERSGQNEVKDIDVFAIDFFKDQQAVLDLKAELLRGKDKVEYLDDEEKIEQFLTGFSNFNNISKQSYLDQMNVINKEKAACAYSRLILEKTPGVKCGDTENSDAEDLITKVKKKTITKLKVLADNGFTDYKTSMSEKGGDSVKLEEEQTPSRSIASLSPRDTVISNDSATPVIDSSPKVEIPLSAQIQKEIDFAQNKLQETISEKAIIDNKVVDTLTQFTPEAPEAKNIISKQKEAEAEIEELKQDIQKYKTEKQRAIAKESNTKLNQDYEQTKQKLASQGLSIQETQELPVRRIQKLAENLAKQDNDNYYSKSVKQALSGKPEIEMIYPISNDEYKEITNNQNLKPISMTIEQFDPVSITNMYLTDVEKDLGGNGSIVIDEKGRHLILVTDKNHKDKIYYQLIIREEADGRKLVKGVYLPVSKKRNLQKAVRVIGNRVLERSPKIEPVQKAIKRSFASTYKDLLETLENSKK